MNYFALTAIINLAAGMAGILLVTVKNKNWKDENKFFIGFCLATMIWSFGYLNWQLASEYSSALFWIRASKIGVILIPILYLHWILNLTIEKTINKKEILKFGYALTLFFLLFSFSPLFIKDVKPVYQFAFWPQPGFLYHFYIIFSYLGLVGYGLIKLFKEYRECKGYPVRLMKIRLIILGTIIGFGGGATNFFLFYNIPIAPYLNILASAGILLMSLAIRKYSSVEIPEESGFDKVRRMYLRPYGFRINGLKTALKSLYFSLAKLINTLNKIEIKI